MWAICVCVCVLTTTTLITGAVCVHLVLPWQLLYHNKSLVRHKFQQSYNCCQVEFSVLLLLPIHACFEVCMCEQLKAVQYCEGLDIIQYGTAVTCVFCVHSPLLLELNDCNLKTRIKWGCITTEVTV